MKALLIKLLNFFSQIKNTVFFIPAKEQSEYLESLGEGEDDWERSYYQYKCQCKLLGKVLVFVYNVASIPIFIYWSFCFGSKRPVKTERAEAVFYGRKVSDDYIPLHLQSCYKDIRNVEELATKEMFLNKKAKQYMRKGIRRYPLSFYFLAKCLYKLAVYSAIIEKYQPDAIIASTEYSFTSSILTGYCGAEKIKHINVMHGEKLFSIRDAYTRFHLFYVWDPYYIELYRLLKSEKTKYYVEQPRALIFNNRNIAKEYDYTYYLQINTVDELFHIERNLRKIKKDKKISIRPHPIYSKLEDVKKVFKDYNIEDCRQVPIEISILRTRNVVSFYSTVLYQAYLNDVDAVMDDLAYPEQFEQLKELNYIMLSKKHRLLSELII